MNKYLTKISFLSLCAFGALHGFQALQSRYFTIMIPVAITAASALATVHYWQKTQVAKIEQSKITYDSAETAKNKSAEAIEMCHTDAIHVTAACASATFLGLAATWWTTLLTLLSS